MKPGESDVERQISIQGLHLSAFGIIFGKEDESLRFIVIHVFKNIIKASWAVNVTYCILYWVLESTYFL